MIWLILLGILILLGLLPLGVRVLFSGEAPRVWVIAGPVRISLFPGKKKEKKEKTDKPKAARKEKKTKKDRPKTAPEKQGGSIKDFLPFVNLALDFLGSFRRKLRINHLELKLIMAGDDPCDLAVNYGKAWAALGNLMPRLEAIFVIKKRDLEVECDFTAQETTVYARAEITITLGRLLGLVTVYGYRALREYLKLRKKRKGERNYEPKSS